MKVENFLIYLLYRYDSNIIKHLCNLASSYEFESLYLIDLNIKIFLTKKKLNNIN